MNAYNLCRRWLTGTRSVRLYKAETQRWWLQRQPWAQEVWGIEVVRAEGKRQSVVRGSRIIKAIGYDTDEPHRVRSSFGDPWEDTHCVPYYPLIEAKLNRQGCVHLIEKHGLPIPTKSACTFCPHNTMLEWSRLRAEEPELFQKAVTMSERAQIDNPEVVGLMRCNPHGKRQLHVWARGGYPDLKVPQEEDEDLEVMPCDCRT